MAHMASLYWTAPFVMAARMNGMWLDALNSTARGRRENSRMVTEKLAAGGESMVAMATEMTRLTMEAAAGGTATLQSQMDSLGAAALKPYSKRATANAKRLSRRKK